MRSKFSPDNIAITITVVLSVLIVSFLVWKKDAFAHPDGATPYWYPTTYLYGFVSGCWETVEQNQSLAEGMWPDDIRAVCGCVVDAIRHSMPFHEAEDGSPESIKKFDEISAGVLPQCIMEVEAGIMMRNGEK